MGERNLKEFGAQNLEKASTSSLKGRWDGSDPRCILNPSLCYSFKGMLGCKVINKWINQKQKVERGLSALNITSICQISRTWHFPLRPLCNR